ncbi:hypothetical protein PUN28_001885 [Cardiocondyla obscurior]|uniref:Uncharacterized protein n=1 Tax=Cardiocondyla obscurior TaxID=286306 RepID=A0AAW2GRV2_9HYME
MLIRFTIISYLSRFHCRHIYHYSFPLFLFDIAVSVSLLVSTPSNIFSNSDCPSVQIRKLDSVSRALFIFSARLFKW